MKPPTVIYLPKDKRKKAKDRSGQNRIKNIDGIKYFTELQIKMLRRSVREQADLDQSKGRITAIREWMVVDLITSSGMRVGEAANVRCGDLKIGYSECEVFVRCGKGSRSRHIQIPKGLKQHLKRFLKWKENRNEPITAESHLFIGQRGPWTTQAIQQIVKKHLKALKIYERGKSCHSLRHSYGVNFYRKSRDIRALGKQLGHATIQTTQIYTDVTKEDIQLLIKGFWN
jgi:integrase/recombinase XerD